MVMKETEGLSRRETQIMEIIYKKGQVSAGDLIQELPDHPNDSTARTFLRILEEKGYLTHVRQGLKYIYSPAADPETTKQSALKKMIRIYFNNSIEDTVAAMFRLSGQDLKKVDLDKIEAMIRNAQERESDHG
jgi:BlaI family transcriptional regulator, penicillinase repressor